MSWGQEIKEINLSVDQLKALPVGNMISSDTERFGLIQIHKLEQNDENQFTFQVSASKNQIDEFDVAYSKMVSAEEFLEVIRHYLGQRIRMQGESYTRLTNGFVYRNTYYQTSFQLLKAILTYLKEVNGDESFNIGKIQ